MIPNPLPIFKTWAVKQCKLNAFEQKNTCKNLQHCRNILNFKLSAEFGWWYLISKFQKIIYYTFSTKYPSLCIPKAYIKLFVCSNRKVKQGQLGCFLFVCLFFVFWVFFFCLFVWFFFLPTHFWHKLYFDWYFYGSWFIIFDKSWSLHFHGYEQNHGSVGRIIIFFFWFWKKKCWVGRFSRVGQVTANNFFRSDFI